MILSLIITRRYVRTAAVVLAVFVVSVFAGQDTSPPFPSRPPYADLLSKEKNPAHHWYKKKRLTKLRGVAIVVHGLNLKPERMGAVIRVLNEAGMDVLNLSLHGHGDNYLPMAGLSDKEARLESFRHVSYTLWAEELRDAYRKARERADAKGVPVYFAGFSLGALLGCDLLASDRDVSFRRMILFAPALNVMIEAHLLKALTPFPNLVIDSLSPPTYRTNDGTPMAAYRALFEAISHLKEQSTDRLDIPTLVFIDENDELVDGRNLTEFARKGLTRWRVVTLHRDKDDRGPQTLSHHLIIDEAGTGREAWKRVETDIRRHVRE